MAKTKISEFSTTPGNNTDINGINIAEGCAPSGINNAIRELMSDLKEWQSGAMDVYVIPQGTAAAPGIQLYGDLDTGLYGYAANQLGVAVGGASAGYFSSAGWVGNVNGTITGDINATTIDTTNLEVTNIKAKDGTAAITIANSTGAIAVSTLLDVDNLRLDGNTLSSTDTNGNITIAPNGTGQVVMSGDLDVANIETTNIKAKDGTASITLANSTGVATFSNPTVMSVDSASDALRITQIGAGNALVVEDATSPDATPTVIDQFGNVILGTTARTTPVTSKVEIHSTSSENLGLTPSLGFYNWSATASFASHLTFRHYPSGTVGTLAANTSGDVLGRVVFLSYDGTNAFSASIRGVSGAGGTAPSITYDASGGHNFTSGPIDVENLEVTNIKARDGTAALSIADSTGAVTVATAFAANGGVTIGDASGDALTINSSAVSTPNGLNFDSNTLVIDATNNRVGINNASPTVALDVTGALTISGNAILGDASTDTVLVNGYMGVGGAPASSIATYIRNSALTGTTQHGIVSSPVGSAAGTSDVSAVSGQPGSNASAYTVSNLYSFWAFDAVKGAGSTITNLYGIDIRDQTQGTNNYGISSRVSSGANKWNIYASGTANNAFAGNVRIGSVTAPTNALDVTGAMTVSGNTTLGDATTDTVQVNGYMGVGGIPSADTGIYLTNTALTGTAQVGVLSSITGSSAATTRIVGFNALVASAAASFTVADLVGFRASTLVKGAGSTVTNTHGVLVLDQTQGTNNFGVTSLVSSGTNKWNIYASGTAANYFAGNVLIGTTTQPTGVGLNVASTLRISNANGGTLQLEDTDVADASAPFFVLQSESSAFKIFSANRSGTGTTGSVERFRLSTTEAVVNDPGNDYDFRVESDTNTHALFVEATNSNVKIGGSAERATTVGTNHLDIFDGTAPVGTLANGISIYSSSGEAYVMDAAGNATLFSPHDSETNEWIFKSKHTPTGKVLKIDVEKLLRFVNNHFGLDAIQEFIEE